ncbi:hypothetical protein MP638_000814 [Amoeboaphelidium occidentale]|nr:hypothetical protein MP638_000814 [Amoeboaphelidium occidentale]
MPKENQKFREGVKRILERAEEAASNDFMAAGIMEPSILPMINFRERVSSLVKQTGPFHTLHPKQGVYVTNMQLWMKQLRLIFKKDHVLSYLNGNPRVIFDRFLYLPECTSMQAFPAEILSRNAVVGDYQKNDMLWLLVQLPSDIMYRLRYGHGTGAQVNVLLGSQIPVNAGRMRWLIAPSLENVYVEPVLCNGAPCAQSFLVYKVIPRKDQEDDRISNEARQLAELIKDCFVESPYSDNFYGYAGGWGYGSCGYDFKESPEMLVVEIERDLPGRKKSGNWRIGCLLGANMMDKLFDLMFGTICYDHTDGNYKVVGLKVVDELISTEKNPVVLDSSSIVRFTEENSTESYQFRGLIMVPAQQRHLFGVKFAGKEYVNAALRKYKNENSIEKVLNVYLDVYDKEEVYASDYILEASEVCDLMTVASRLQNKEILPKIISHAAEVDHKLLEEQEVVNIAAKGLVKFVENGSYNLHVTRRNLPFLMLLTKEATLLRSEDAQYFSDKLCMRIHGFCRRHIVELLKEPELMTKILDHYEKFQYCEYYEALLEFIEKNSKSE